jgi:hypothetical protein
MALALPSKHKIDDFYSRVRALLWGAFEVLLLILDMIAVAIFAWSHIPGRHTGRLGDHQADVFSFLMRYQSAVCSPGEEFSPQVPGDGEFGIYLTEAFLRQSEPARSGVLKPTFSARTRGSRGGSSRVNQVFATRRIFAPSEGHCFTITLPQLSSDHKYL